MRPRQSPLAFAPDADATKLQSWRHGAQVACLGETLTLRLSTTVSEAARVDDELHLPLPPQASERQIRDRCEAWLRAQAQSLIGRLIHDEANRVGQPAPPLRLSFARRGHWTTSTDDGALQCNWRLIEQPPRVVAHVVSRALMQHWASAGRLAVAGELF